MFKHIKGPLSKKKKPAKQHPETLRYEELEQRVLFSADIAPGLETLVVEEQVLVENVTADVLAEQEAAQQSVEQKAAETRQELVLVNENVADYQQLIDDLQAGDDNRTIEVVVLESNREGIEQVSDILAERTDLAAVHVISHGTDGQINLGDSWLNSSSLQQNSEAVAGWGSALTETGDILFYGCNVAADGDGQRLLEEIAVLSGANVAASDDPSGHESLNADWVLEHQNGSIETESLGSDDILSNWRHTLAPTSPGTAIWRTSGDSTPNVNDWNGTGFVGAVDSADLGQWRIVEAAEAPTRDEIIAIGVDNQFDTIGYVKCQVWDGATWTEYPFASSFPSIDTTSQSFDVAYESNSGDAMLVWNNVAGDTASVSYRIWDGTDWSAEATITAPVAGVAQQLRLAASPINDEMVLIVSDDSTNEWAMVWDGTSWGNAVSWNKATSSDRSEIAVAYEAQSGHAMVVYDGSDNYNDLTYQTWNGSTWSGPQTLALPYNFLVETEAEFTNLASDPTSDRIAIGVVANGTENQVLFAVWDGSAWGEMLTATTSAYSGNTMSAAVAFESQSGQLMATYGEFATTPRYQTWTSSGGWSGEQNIPDIGAYARVMSLAADPATDALMLGVQDDQSDLNYILWDGTAWGAANEVTDNTGETVTRPFTFVFDNATTANIAPAVSLPGGTVNYTENDSPTVIDPTATITDDDSADFDGGSLTIDFSAGGTANDRLAILSTGIGQGQISVSGNEVRHENTLIGTFTGGTDGSTPLVITFNMNADETPVQDLMRHITYENVSESPNTAARTVRFVMTDGDGGTSNPVTKTINVTAVNDAPELDNSGTLRLTMITEDDTNNNGNLISEILASDGDLPNPVNDADAGALEGIAINSLNSSNGTWEYNIGSGWNPVGTVTWNSSLLLRDTDRLRFVPDGLNADFATVTFTAWDQTSGTAGTKVDTFTYDATGAFSYNVEVATIEVTAVNDAPTVDLNGSDGAGSNFTVTFTEDGGAVNVTDIDAIISDVDDTTYQSLSVNLNAFSDGVNERIVIAGYTFAYGIGDTVVRTVGSTDFELDFDGSGFNVMKDGAGTMPLDDLQTLMRGITYENISQNPTAGDRVVNFIAQDASGLTGPTETSTITVMPENDAPVVSASVGTTAYTEQAAATVIDAGLTLVDPDGFDGVNPSDQFTAVIQITGNYEAADTLGFTDTSNIQGALVGDTLTLSVIGGQTATVADFQAALRTVTFYNESDTPSELNRTITFSFDDGVDSSNLSTKTVQVSAVNDAPMGTNNTVSTDEDTDYVFTADDFGFSDPNDSPSNNFANVIITTTVANGTLYVDANGNGIVDGAEVISDGDTVSVADITAGNLKFKPAADANGTNYDSFTFQVQDDGGGSDTNPTVNTMTINVNAVNDAAPVATDDIYSVDEDSTLTADWWNTAWTLRQELTFDNTAQAETLTDFPVLVTLNASNIDYTQTKDDGSDLRFFAADGTQLSYEIEQWNESGDSSVWVRVPQIIGNSNSDSIWMYYGNATAQPVANAAEVWDSNFVGVWHLNQEQSGTGNVGIYKDSTGTGNNGIDRVAATGQEGQIPGGQEFGTSDWIEIPHDTSLDLKSSMTISFWIKPTSDSGTYNRIVEKGVWGYEDSYYFGGGDGTNDLTFYLNNQLVIETPDDVLTVDEWQHAALSFTDNGDGTGTARLYLNGSEIATGNYSNGVVVGNNESLAIGHSNSSYDFDGFIDEVQISNTDRSADWIAAQYQATKNQFGAEFVQFGGEESAPASGGVLSNDSDVDNDPLTVTLVDGPDNAQSFTLNKDGTFTYTPTANYHGTDTFTYEINDGNGGTTQATATITINNIEDEATITGDISYSGSEGDTPSGDLNATDVDGLSDNTYFTITAQGTNGTAAINAETGAWTFTPNDSNWFGSDSFTVTVTDDLGGTTTQVVNITLANVDDAAVITGDVSFSGNEGDTPSGDLNATDVDGLTDNTYFTVTAQGSNGTAAIDSETGAWTFTPTDSNWFGSDSFTVTVTDDLGGTTTQVVNITLANVDDSATITGNISYSGNEGDTPSGDLNATDADGLTDTTYFTISAQGSNGTAAIDTETGAWTFTPTDPNWFGSDSFTVTVTDDLGGTTTQVVSITLANVDDPAIITGNISYSGNEGDTPTGDLNATDVEGLTDNTYFTVTAQGSNGTATINAETGAWTFTPTDSNWFGSDSFTVTVTDDLGGTTTQVVNITLANVDDSAVVTGDVSFSGDEGDAVSGDLNATDVEGLTDNTYFTVTAQGSNGTAAIDEETGAWTFTPTDANWFGSDSFTVTVTDDLGGTTTQVVNITLANVDDPAIITGDVSFSGNEGDTPSGDLNASDVEGLTDNTYYTISAQGSNGTAAINAETGAWTFTPTDANWFGSDSFTVTVTDDLGGTTTQVVNIALANVDDAAVISGDISYSGNEGDTPSGDLNATDVDGLTDLTYFTISAQGSNGTAAINADTGAWTFTPTDANWFGSDSFTVTVTDDLGGTTTQVVNITLANVDDAAVITGDVSYTGNEGDAVAGDMDASDVDGLSDTTYFSVTTPASNGTVAINAETGAWTFTPTDSNWFGSDSFTVTITDDLGGTTTQVVSITLANIDDTAVITGNISYSGDEGDTPSGDLNATDVDGLTDLTYFTISAQGSNGTAAINAETGAWTFTPTDANWFGSDSFEVTVTDDLGGTTTQVVNITLANIDDTAVITGNISYSGDEGDTPSGDLNATDVDGLTDNTYFAVSAQGTNGTAAIDAETGAWTFTPTDSNWFGSDSFTVTVTDDLGGTTTQVVNITLANVDDAAVITGDVSYSGNEGDAVTGDMNASDVEGLTDNTYYTISAQGSNGTAAINAETGAWTFTPTDANWFGSDSFTVTVTDDLGGTTTQVVNITLANVDDSAVITGDISYTGNEGDAVSGVMNATDVEGLTDNTYFTVSAQGSNGTAVIDAETGAWTFTPTDANWFGSDSFTVTVTDDLGGTTTQVVNITLTNVDDGAVITGDVSFSGNEGDAVSGDLNATDVDGLTDNSYFTVSAQGSNGTAAINAETGAWTFTPNDANWFGSDSFTVTVTDDLGGTTTQVVNITLANIDDTAVITGNISYSGNEGDTPSGDLNATDVEGLTDGTYFSVTTPATNGTAAINSETGAWTFTPTDSNWFGSDSFTVTVTDDLGGTTTQVVNITLANVDDAAVITGDVSFIGNEGDSVAGDLNATDVDGLTDGTYFSVTTPATNGTAAIDAETGTWAFTPTDANWFGSDAFTVTVTDDLGGTTTQVVSITLTNVDDPAIITGNISYSGNEGDTPAGDLNATDVDGLTDNTYFTISAQGSNGTAAINSETGAWTFTPTDSNWFGNDSFTVTVTDDLGGTTTQVVSVTLANANDPAAITGDVSFSGNEGDTPSGDLNATDVDGLTDSTYFTISAQGSNGTAAIDAETGAWTFTPTDSNWFGSDSFTVTVTDDLGGTTTQVVNITLANVDDPAIITGNISYSGNEGDTPSGDLNATDADGLTDNSYFTISAQGSNGTAAIDAGTGAWTFTPTDSNWFGSDSFTVTVTDDLGGTTTQVVNITLANVDDAATITGDISFNGNEGDTPSGDLNATDVDGLTDNTYFTVTAQGSNGTAAINAETGAWTFTPTDANWFGSDSFTVTVTDDLGGTTTQVVNIALANVDDAAVISGDISYSGNEGDAVSGVMNATDIEGLTDNTYFTVSAQGSNGTAVIDAETGAWTFTPNDANWFGSDAFTVTVTDDLGGTTTQVVNVTLANVDDAAVITGNISYSGNEGDTPSGDLNATDVDGLTDLTYFTISAQGSNGTAAIDAETGAWTFTPSDANWFGSDSFEVTVTDDLGGTTTQVVNITLANVDDAATITGNISYSGNEGDTPSGDLNATDVDGLTDSTYFTVSAQGSNGTAAIDAETGAWTFTPSDANWFGSDSFEVTVTDDLGGTTTQVVNITLANVDDAAVITGNISYSGNEGDTPSGDLNATDVDGLTDLTYFTISAQGSNGTAAINADTGAWTFTPTDPNWFGSDSFTVTVTDDQGGTTTQTVSITLANVDDAPSAKNDSFSINEDTMITGNILSNDSDSDGDALNASLVSGPNNGSLNLNADGSFSYTPGADWNGTDSFTYRANDGALYSNVATVAIIVNPVNDAPLASNTTINAAEDTVFNATLPAATDADGDAITCSLDTDASRGTVIVNSDGSFSYTPDQNLNGSDSFTYTVSDGHGGSNTYVVNLNVAAVNDAPTETSSPVINATENESYSYTITASDLDGDTLTFSAATLPSWLTLNDNGDGTATLTGTPTNVEVGNHRVVLEVSDGSLIDSQSFTINVSEAVIDLTDQVLDISNLQDRESEPDAEPSFDEPETDTTKEPESESTTLDETTEELAVEETPPTIVKNVTGPDESIEANEAIALSEDPDTPESDEIIYLTDEVITEAQTEDRDDDKSLIFYDNDLYKEMYSPKFLAASYTVADSSLPMTGDDIDFSLLDFDSEDQSPFVDDDDYNLLRREIDESFNNELKTQELKSKVVTATAASFAAGIVSYLLRVGSMVSSLMSSLPLWRGFDPIAIFSGDKTRPKDQSKMSNQTEPKSETFFDGEVK